MIISKLIDIYAEIKMKYAADGYKEEKLIVDVKTWKMYNYAMPIQIHAVLVFSIKNVKIFLMGGDFYIKT